MQKAVTPQDIADSETPGQQLAVSSLIEKINTELLRQQYKGPETFWLPLAHNLTEGARTAIVRPYLPHWRNARIEQIGVGESAMWCFRLDAIPTPGDDE